MPAERGQEIQTNNSFVIKKVFKRVRVVEFLSFAISSQFKLVSSVRLFGLS